MTSFSPSSSESRINESIETPYTATFAIYTNNTFRTFTASMYHNKSDEAYITATNPNTVIVENPEYTWQDFFDTLPFTITPECLTTGTGQTFCTTETESLSYYLNGINTPDALSKHIQPKDQLLVSFSSQNNQQIQAELEELSKLSLP